MNWSRFILLQVILIILLVGLLYLHKDKLIIVKRPPESLADWYKPNNKRQVWLHTMFNLRREMQAIELYNKQENAPLLNSWVTKFDKHYSDIAEMVPEWESKLDLTALISLKNSSATNDYQRVIESVLSLKKSCDSCHDDYQTTTALIYRSPQFDEIQNDSDLSFEEQMSQLSYQINQVKIAMTDDQKTLALEALSSVKDNMDLLGTTCSTCHEKNPQTYPSNEMQQSLINLEAKLIDGTLKEQGQELGTLAVIACAKCHGTHRFVHDANIQASEMTDWQRLFKH